MAEPNTTPMNIVVVILLEDRTIKPTLLKAIMEEVILAEAMQEEANRLQMEIRTKAPPPKPHHRSRAEEVSRQERSFLWLKRCRTLVND